MSSTFGHTFRISTFGESHGVAVGVTVDGCPPRLPLDVAEFHTYAVDWSADRATFLVDDEVVRTVPSPPTYPLQLMVAVFDFPEDSVGDDDHLVPALVVDYLRGS